MPAESTVRMKYFGDAQSAEAALVKLERKHLDLENKIRRAGRTSKSSASEAVRAFEELGSRLLSVTALTQAGTIAWQRYATSVTEVGKAEAALRRTAVSALGTASTIRGAERLQFVRSLPGILPEQVEAALRGVEAGGSLLGRDRQEQLARTFAALSPALAPLDEQGKVSDTRGLEAAANIGATLADAFGDKLPGDIADLTVALQKAVGPDGLQSLTSGRFEVALASLQRRGFADERALATLAVGIESGLSPKELLNRETLRQLDQGKIAGVEQTLLDAQRQDVARALLRESAETDPLGLIGQGAAADLRRTRGGESSLAELLDTAQRARWSRAQGFWESTFALIQEGFEEAGFGFNQFIPGQPFTGAIRERLQPVTDELVAQKLGNLERLMEEQNNLMRQEPRPHIRRDAHQEGRP